MESYEIDDSGPYIDATVKIHKSSYVDDEVQIGAGTSIWHFCHVMTESKIGKNCRIGQNVVIGPRAIIGNNVKIQNNVSVYTGVILEDDVFCGPSMVFTNIQTPRSAFPRNKPEDNLPTLVQRGASIGANATIVCGCKIGQNALIGAGSVVTKDVQPHSVVYGNPARHRGWACSCGIVLKMSENHEAVCEECGRQYHINGQSCVAVQDDGIQDQQVVPVCDVRCQYELLKEKIDEAIIEVATDGKYILGENVKAFEVEMAGYCQSKHAIGVGNGTDALYLALRALGVGLGDEVITTPFTFIATTEAILMVGATPVFVDIDPETLNIDHRQIEAAITKQTTAILPVHLYGRPCEMSAIMSIARKHDLKVIEDCAQALGATYAGQPVGTFGDAGCLSFFPSKNLGCMGDGGMVITNDFKVNERVEMLRRHGARLKYHHEEIGVNSRLDEIQAATLRVKLPYLDQWNKQRQAVARTYSECLSKLTGIQVPQASESEINHVYHQYTVLVERREDLVNSLRSAGVHTAIYYPTPLHLQPVHADLGHSLGDFPKAEKAAVEVLSLPIYPGLSDVMVRKVTESIRCSNYYMCDAA